MRCVRCAQETAGRRGRPVCGPCALNKPIGWWDELPAVLERVVWGSRGKTIVLEEKP